MDPDNEIAAPSSEILSTVRRRIRAGFDQAGETPPDLSALGQHLHQLFDEHLRSGYVITIAGHFRQPDDLLFPQFQHAVPPRTPEDDHAHRDQIQRLALENERYKTQLISLHRQLLEQQSRLDESARQAARLEMQNDGQMDCINRLAEANAALQRALIERESGRLGMHEASLGIVTRRLEDGVVVEFETEHGPDEQFFENSQFLKGRVPEEGDRIDAYVFLWQREVPPTGLEEYLTPDEIQHGFTGFVKGIERAEQRRAERQKAAIDTPAPSGNPGDRVRPR